MGAPAQAVRAAVELDHVTKVYPGGHVALRHVSLSVPAHRTTVLIGPSGCGKTTALRLINRLIEPTSGVVRVDGCDVRRRDPIELRRSIGYVIQDGGLFPHMTARENVEIVPRLLGWPEEKRRERVRQMFDLVRLPFEPFASRYPAQLSGGQRQRVGLARALAADPPLVLMDEPLGALDPISRRELQAELRDLVHRIGRTVVLVTHDIEEAFLLADRIVVMGPGRIEQVGTPEEVRLHPETALVRSLVAGARTGT